MAVIMEMHAFHNWSDGDTLYVKFNIVNHIVISLSMCDIFDVFTVCFRSHLFIRHKLIIRMLFCLFIRSFVCFEWNSLEIQWLQKWIDVNCEMTQFVYFQVKQWHFILDAQKPMMLTNETKRRENKKMLRKTLIMEMN